MQSMGTWNPSFSVQAKCTSGSQVYLEKLVDSWAEVTQSHRRDENISQESIYPEGKESQAKRPVSVFLIWGMRDSEGEGF